MIWEMFIEERKYLRDRIDLFNKYNLPYSSINYIFIEKLAGEK